MQALDLKEAAPLLAADQYEGAYYLVGYAVGCALKACICTRTGPGRFPPPPRTVSDLYSHDLARLLELAGLKDALDHSADAMLKASWRTVRDWKEQSRYNYNFPDATDARELYAAAPIPHRSVAMATPLLVGRDLAQGERLLAELDREGLPIIAAFWRNPTADSDWRLVIATPLVDQQGRQDPVVRQLRQTLRAADTGSNFSTSLTFPGFTPYAPYLSDNDAGVTLYVYRLARGSQDAAALPHRGGEHARDQQGS